MPGWDAALERIEKRALDFVWRGSTHKVKKTMLYAPKEWGGIRFWNLKAKAAASRSKWIAKLLNGETNEYLQAAFEELTSHHAVTANTDVPIWESRLDHSQCIVKTTGSPLLATLQRDWATVVRRAPTFTAGQTVAVLNSDDSKEFGADRIFRAVCMSTVSAHHLRAVSGWFLMSGVGLVFKDPPQ